MPARNAIVLTAGQFSPALNNSLRAILETCREFPETFARLYAARQGAAGLLREELLDLSAQPEEEIRLLRTSPGAGALGAGDYALDEDKPEDLARLLAVLRAHDAGFLFCLGGRGALAAADLANRLAAGAGEDLTAVGLPHDPANDLGDAAFRLLDHSPGYGSAARLWPAALEEAGTESGECAPVLVLEAPAGQTGFLAAAARLADPRRELPLLLFLEESGLDLEDLADGVNDTLKQRGRCLVALAAGFAAGEAAPPGPPGLGAAQAAAAFLNEVGLSASGRARGEAPGAGRGAAALGASPVDLDEAFKLGQQAVLIAVEQEAGWLAAILRRPGLIYSPEFTRAPLAEALAARRAFPGEWLAPGRMDVSDDFLRYARPLAGEDLAGAPLVGGRPRFARLQPILAPRRCPPYVPQGWR